MSNAEPINQQLLQTLVPVNALTCDHLTTLLRNQTIETLCKGQTLFNSGQYDNHHVYLLSGTVRLLWDDTAAQHRALISADDPDSRFALAHHQPRRCSAIAHSDCRIIRFNSDQLDGMLAWDQACEYIILDICAQRDLDEDADWMLTLLRSNLFYKVPPMNIRQILNKFTPQYVESGETVLRQGEVGDCCYFIKEGQVGVYQAKDERSPSEQVAELGPGRCFGEDALVNDAPRNATIVAHSNTVLMRLEKRDFFLLLKPMNIDSMTLTQARQQSESPLQWLDVRAQDEYDLGHYEGALHMPLNLLKLKSRMLDKTRRYIIYCNSGRRSTAAASLLSIDGYNVCVLEGGFMHYSAAEQAWFESINAQDILLRGDASHR